MTKRGEVLNEDIEDRAGYGKPPATTRFRKGQSGNPRGRPKDRHRNAPYEAVLGQMVTVREGGAERRVTAAEAFLLQLVKRGLDGDGAAARAATRAIEEAKPTRAAKQADVLTINHRIVAPGSVTLAIEPLRMARMLDRYRESARMMLEPWLVEAAIARLGDRRLTPEGQRIVVRATHNPHKVSWPEWWSERG